MANYHQTGFYTLQELAKERQVTQAKAELAKFQELKQKEKTEIERLVEAFADCA